MGHLAQKKNKRKTRSWRNEDQTSEDRGVLAAQACLVDQGYNFDFCDESRTVLNFSGIRDAVHLKIVWNKLRAAFALNTLFYENAGSFFNRNRR
jgi:hypothetical protein